MPKKKIVKAVSEEKKEQVYFEPVLWRGVKMVFQCATCKTCRDTRDAMVLHVLLHVPADQQNEFFEKLMNKEK